MSNRMHHRGSTFIITLWLLVALAALAVTLAFGARVQRQYAANVAAATEVRHTELAALRYIIRALTDSSGELPSDTDMPCCGMRVGNTAFWIIRPDDVGDGEQRYGLTDEGGRIDLNTAPLSILEKLPEITPDVAASIIDWRDTDETVTDAGAESDFYLRNPIPYNAKNGPFETVEELRLVAGVTDEILWGEDTNRNGMLDEWENDGADSAPDDDRDGRLNRGLAGWTSAYIRWPEQQQQQQGGGGQIGQSQTVNVNSATRQQLEQTLSNHVDAARAVQLADLILGQRPVPSIFHLYYNTPLSREEFDAMETVLVFREEQPNTFRLNLNAAPVAAIACLPGLGEAEAQSLLEARPALASSQSLGWALDVIDKNKLMEAATVPLVGRSYAYSADIVCVSANGRAFSRAKYVFDASGSAPRVIWRQDLTARGWPMDTKLLDRLRAGEALDDVLSDSQASAGL